MPASAPSRSRPRLRGRSRSGRRAGALSPRFGAAKPRGVTIIEIVVVLLIVMILAGMVVPAVGAGIRSSKLRDAATRTATAFRRARSMAIAACEMYCVYVVQVPYDELRDRQASIRIHPADGFVADLSTSLGGAMLPKGVGFVGGPSDPTELTRLFFMPDGTAALDSGVLWKPVKLVYVKPGASSPEPGRYEIAVRPLTGRIAVKFKR